MVEGPRRAQSHSRQQGVHYQMLLLYVCASERRCGAEDVFTVWGAREPGEAEANTVGPVVSTESVPCVELLDGVGWATGVAAGGGSAEPVPTSVGTAKTESKSCLLYTSPSPRDS